MAFFCRGKIELVGWIHDDFREIDLGAMNAVVSSKLNQCKNRVQHTEREGRKGEQSPDGNVLEFPACQVEDP
jgi:hypothetical protein